MFTATLLLMFAVPVLAMILGWAFDLLSARPAIDLGRSGRPSGKADPRRGLRFDPSDPVRTGSEPRRRIARRA